jgi:hypothetical protein
MLLGHDLWECTDSGDPAVPKRSIGRCQVQSGLKGLIRDGEVVRVGNRPFLVDPLFERWIQIQG